jgi:LmbE family N-acetylglucosaminyl deacetylase
VTRRLAAVFAHPDDDTFGLAGTLALSPGDIEYTLVLATSGEAGPISDPSLASRENLAEVREGEAREALRVAGAENAEVHFLRHPDGGLKDVPRDELVQEVARVLRTARPEVVVTFGPEGITKHDDHIAIGAAATEGFHTAREQAQPEGSADGAFQRLLYVAIPEADIQRFWEELRARGVEMGDPEGPFMPRGVPDHTVTHRVDCSSVVKRKIEAIRAHRTQQVELEYLPEDLQPEVLGVECFVQAFPPVTEEVDRAAGSIFEGVQGLER